MRSNPWKIVHALVLGSCLLASLAVADKPKTDAAHDAMMAAMMKAASPGPQHQALVKSLAGNWKTSAKSWMGGPEPAVSEGKSVMTPVLGGRFVQEQHNATMAEGPFEGLGLYGYDNMKKSYLCLWMDNWGTGAMLMTGSMDASGKVLTFHGSFDDPATGKEKTMRLVSRMVDENTRMVEIYGDHEGKEAKQLEITYKRV